MKFGVRKPSIKKSISARTTGKLKRQVKRAVNPLYGKKGMGYVNDPQKAIYNKVYNKTTLGTKDILKSNTSSSSKSNKVSEEDIDLNNPGWGCVKYFYIALLFVLGFFTLPWGVGVIFIGLGIFFIIRNKRKSKETSASNDIDDSEAEEQIDE